MKRVFPIRYLLMALVILAAPLSAFSGSSPLSIEASVDKTVITADERLTLKITVSGEIAGTLPTPSVPKHEGFDIEGGPLRSSSFSWINGKVSASKTISYTLRPHSAGTFKVGETSVTYNGETYVAKPIEIRIEKADLPPSAASEGKEDIQSLSADPLGRVMVSASLNKSQVFVGESIVYTFSFFRKVRLWESPQLSMPDFSDFWVEDLPTSRKAREVIIKGERYIREDVKKILYPSQEGRLTIQAASIGVAIDPFAKPIVLSAEPVGIEVLPLPPKPENFSGAVGNFTIKSEVDNKKAAEGEPVTIKVELAGIGNIKALPAPIFEETGDFKSYEPKDSMEISTLNELIAGTKTFEYLFIPLKSGILSLPSFSFTFFDAEDKKFKTVRTNPVEIEVQGTKLRSMTEPTKGDGEKTSAEEAQERKLRPIRTKSDLGNWNPRIYTGGLYPWVIASLPLLLTLVLYSKKMSKEKAARKNVSKTAFSILHRAENMIMSDHSQDFFPTAFSALTYYLLDTFQLSKAATKEEVLKNLERLDFSEELISNVKKVFHTADLGIYAPTKYGKREMEQFLSDARQIIGDFEKIKSMKMRR